MTRVKAISNFANDEHLQGDVFDITDDAEVKRLVEVQAVEVVHEATPVTEPAPQPVAAPAPVAPQPVPTATQQPTPEQISHDVAQVEQGNTQV
jgi:hypothetical protein